jgi:hypothetical protein
MKNYYHFEIYELLPGYKNSNLKLKPDKIDRAPISRD